MHIFSHAYMFVNSIYTVERAFEPSGRVFDM